MSTSIALCAIARLENNYIREWVEHYYQIGFKHIYLYDNNLPDGELLNDPIQDYIDKGFVTVIDVRRKGTCQIESYINCYENYGEKYSHMAFFDIDEFLMIDGKQKITEIIDTYNNFDIICLSWINYHDNGLIKVINNDYSLVKRFTKPTIQTVNNRKCICKTGLHNIKINAHGPSSSHLSYCNSEAKPIEVTQYGFKNTANISLKNMHINHYRFKAIEEFIINRMAKGDGCKAADGSNIHPEWFTLNEFYQKNGWTQEKEDYANFLIKKFNLNIK